MAKKKPATRKKTTVKKATKKKPPSVPAPFQGTDETLFGDQVVPVTDELTKTLSDTLRAMMSTISVNDELKKEMFWGRVIVENLGFSLGIRFYFGQRGTTPKDGLGRVGVIYGQSDIIAMQQRSLDILRKLASRPRPVTTDE